MAEAPLFSIVIPCYNYGHWLPRAVNSVLAQDGADWELLVINDGSTDTTDAVAAELLNQHGQRLRYLAQPNRGVAATRNRGIDATTGRYLIFLDADDELAPGALVVYRDLIARNPGIDMVAGSYRVCTADGRERLQSVGTLARSPRRRLRHYLFAKKLHLCNGAMAIRRQVFAVRRYPETLRAVEDIPVFAYLVACRQLAVSPAPLAIIHRHAASLRHNAERAAEVGMTLLDELFRAGLMPDWALAYRPRYETRRHLSLFRTCYLAGENARAVEHYHDALRSDPLRTLGRWSYLGKYLRLRCRWPHKSQL
jgi:glycosyltransferase involved in cell wall biosynthesis